MKIFTNAITIAVIMMLLPATSAFSQVKIGKVMDEDSHLVWSTYGFQYENEGDDIYFSKDIKVEKDDNKRTHLGNATKLWITNDSIYYLKFTRPIAARKTYNSSKKTKFINTIFCLSNTKEGALQAIKDIISAVQSLEDGKALKISDYKGNSFELRYRADDRYELYNPTMSVSYVGRVKPLQQMVDNVNEWR